MQVTLSVACMTEGGKKGGGGSRRGRRGATHLIRAGPLDEPSTRIDHLWLGHRVSCKPISGWSVTVSSRSVTTILASSGGRLGKVCSSVPARWRVPLCDVLLLVLDPSIVALQQI